MDSKTQNEQAIAALIRVGDLLENTYGKNRERFTLDKDERTRLEYTLHHFVDFVRLSQPDPTNAPALELVKSDLSWLWGIVLYQANPIRSVVGDKEMNKVLGELAWVETLTREGSNQQAMRCGQCDRVIPGNSYSLCAECQVEGYRICAYCGQGVASTTNPYCDQCAEVIVGAG